MDSQNLWEFIMDIVNIDIPVYPENIERMGVKTARKF